MCDEGVLTTAAAAYSRDGERRLTAGGATLPDSSRWRETLPVRTFVPDDLRLIKVVLAGAGHISMRCQPDEIRLMRLC